MGITPQQRAAAEARQHAAAHDTMQQIRLVAGPGTGKSSAIKERVNWLLGRGVRPETIYVVSFMRASSRDLKTKIREYCVTAGNTNVDRSQRHNASRSRSNRSTGGKAVGWNPDPYSEVFRYFARKSRVRMIASAVASGSYSR